MTLKSVDLPRIGPMTEKDLARAHFEAHAESAARAPKLFDTPSTASTISAVIRRLPWGPCSAAGGTHEPVRREEDDQY